MNESNKNKLINIIVIVIGALLIIGLLYFLFFRNSNDKNDKQESDISKSVSKVVFTKKVSGKYGELYLANDGKVYLDLNNSLLSNGLLNLEQEYFIQQNDIYNGEKINAILLNIYDVITVDYINDNSNGDDYYNIKTNKEEYNIKNSDIINNSIIDMISSSDINDSSKKDNKIKKYIRIDCAQDFRTNVKDIGLNIGYCFAEGLKIVNGMLIEKGICKYQDVYGWSCDETKVPILICEVKNWIGNEYISSDYCKFEKYPYWMIE